MRQYQWVTVTVCCVASAV